MSLDGLSFSNLGMYRPASPSEVAHQAEQTSQQEAKKLIKEVEELEKIELNPDDKKKNQDESTANKEKEDDNEEQYEDDFIENRSNLNQYSVKFNNQSNLVELLNKTTGEIIETISPEDLVNLMSKSKNPSGVLVDRSI